jgi:parallel beta-helix repeat protein
MGGYKIRKQVLILVFSLIFCLVFCGASSAATISVHPGDSIQSAVDNANIGDYINVYDSQGTSYTYNENIVVNKDNITLSANGDVTVNATDPSKPVFDVQSNYVTIQGFKITGANGTNPAVPGIRIHSYPKTLSNDIIQNNKIFGCGEGIETRVTDSIKILNNKIINNGYGISLDVSNNAIVSGNTISDSFSGIDVGNSVNVRIDGNIVTKTFDAIGLLNSNGCEISNNSINYNQEIGISIDSVNSAEIHNNTINHNTNGIILEGYEQDLTLPNTDLNIFNNTINNNSENGIYLWGFSGSNILKNTISGNSIGIQLSSESVQNELGTVIWAASQNNIISNNIYGNGVGISFTNESPGLDNAIHLNRIVDNTTWDITNNSTETVDAVWNWWGSNSTPASRIYGDVIYNPWLVLTVTAPSSVGQGSSALINLDMNHDSNNGTNHSINVNGVFFGYFQCPDTVYFNTDKGNIVSSKPLDEDGFGAAFLGIPLLLNNFSPAHVSVTVDHQTITKTLTIDPIKISQVAIAAIAIQNYYKIYQKYPPYWYVFGQKMTMPQFLEVMSLAILRPNGFTLPANFETIKTALNPIGNNRAGNIGKTELMSLATSVKNYIQNNGRAPNYINTSLGKISFNNLLNLLTRTIIFYNTNKRLPNYVKMTYTPIIIST